MSPSQKEAIRDGSIEDNSTMCAQVRNKMREAVKDFNFILRNHSLIKSERGFELEDEPTANMIGRLLYLVDNDCIDEDLIWLLLESAEESWTVPGSEYVHGKREELALEIFVACFEDYDPDGEMTPPPTELEHWERFCDALDDFEEV